PAEAAVRRASGRPLPMDRYAEPLTACSPSCDRCPALNLCGGAVQGCGWDSCTDGCAACGVRCPQRRDLAAWLAAVPSFALEDLVGELPAPPVLPHLVPVVDLEELVSWDVARHWPAWA